MCVWGESWAHPSWAGGVVEAAAAGDAGRNHLVGALLSGKGRGFRRRGRDRGCGLSAGGRGRQPQPRPLPAMKCIVAGGNVKGERDRGGGGGQPGGGVWG